MQKRFISIILIAYSACVIKLLVFKISLIRIGHMKFRFAPETGESNFLPFKTIWPYLQGKPNWFFAMLNLGGNIGLLVPVGFLVPFVYKKMTWQKSLALAVAFGLTIEVMELAFGVGIFDIDDVILNALGVMIGYWASAIFVKWRQRRLSPVQQSH
jgi:glycopeptide antibiotics resistance protein